MQAEGATFFDIFELSKVDLINSNQNFLPFWVAAWEMDLYVWAKILSQWLKFEKWAILFLSQFFMAVLTPYSTVKLVKYFQSYDQFCKLDLRIDFSFLWKKRGFYLTVWDS